MSAVDELTDKLIAAGMTPGAAAALVARAGVELSARAPSSGATRTARWRAKKASQTVTERHAVTPPDLHPEASPNVTERHKPSPRDAAHISSSTSSDLIQDQKKENKKEGQPGKRASRIPDDWQLEQRHIDYAISKGVAPERIPSLGEKFKNHFMAASGKGSVSPDWFRKWCNWVINDVDWNGAKNGQRSGTDRTSSAAGRAPAGQDAILAGMGKHADRVRERLAAERRERDVSGGDDAPGGPDARLL